MEIAIDQPYPFWPGGHNGIKEQKGKRQEYVFLYDGDGRDLVGEWEGRGGVEE